MTRRGLTFLLLCASAVAQLPRSQAPTPSDLETEGKRKRTLEIGAIRTAGRVDAIVTDMEGRPVPGLTAADFSVETDGKSRTVESCQFHSNEPLRLVVILDDLGLTLEQSNEARRSLRTFVEKLRPEDEMAVLRTSEGSGTLDRLSSDRQSIQAAIDRAHFQPLSALAGPNSFAAGAVGLLRAVLEGMRELPGRQQVLLISSGLRAPVKAQLGRTANRAAAVVYGVNLGAAPNAVQLDEGVAALAKETSGEVLDGNVARGLQRIANDQSGYYVLTFNADNAGYDYIARGPRVGRVAVRTSRLQTAVRARDGLYGVGEDAEGEGYHEVEREFERAIGSELTHDGIDLRVTPMLARSSLWQIESAVHVNARDLTFVKSVDGRYRTSLDTELALFDESGEAYKETVRSFDANLNEKSFLEAQQNGFDYTVVLALPKEGVYQARVVIRDARSGRIGSARRFLRAEGWQGGKLAMSSILLRGEMEKKADGLELVRDAQETGSIRHFAAGHKMSYNFTLFNYGMNKEKGGEVAMSAEIWRDGVRIFTGEPRVLKFAPSEAAAPRVVTGWINLGGTMVPGAYLMKIEVTDHIAPRTVTQWMDFEVHP
jgi:VWFA-related protein